MAAPASDVPDVLAPNLRCVFCGINPGRVSAAAAAHFANPRNDFWRLLEDAGFTPRPFAPEEQFALLELGYGVTNAAYRTTPGSSDLRRRDFDGARLEQVARELRPRAIAFVGKEAYRGAFGERPELGPQARAFGNTLLYVLPSTSPANAAVPYAERLHWFRALHEWLEPRQRAAVRALVVDERERVLLMHWQAATGVAWWIAPGGGVIPGESDESALRRELVEETGLRPADIGPVVWRREHFLPYGPRMTHQHESFRFLRVQHPEIAPEIDLAAENVLGYRWWTLEELETTRERISPPSLAAHLRTLLRDGSPAEPVDVGDDV